MKTYLATISFVIGYYDSRDDDEQTKTHIVKAKTEEEAKNKAIAYYEDKTEQYSIYYRVTNVVLTEEIE